jgi:hypothetical protein
MTCSSGPHILTVTCSPEPHILASESWPTRWDSIFWPDLLVRAPYFGHDLLVGAPYFGLTYSSGPHILASAI